MSNYSFDDKNKEKSDWNFSSASNTSPSDTFQNYQQPPSFQTNNPPLDNSLSGLRNLGGSAPIQPRTENTAPSTTNDQRSRRLKLISFEDFIKNKTTAFLYFSKHPDTQQQFAKSDVDETIGLLSRYNRSLSYVYFGTCLVTLLGDHLLRQKNVIYGMTYRSSILKILVKFWVIPTAATSTASALVLDNMYIPRMNQIAQRYNYNESIFRQTYDKGEIPVVVRNQQTTADSINNRLNQEGDRRE